MSPPIYRVVFDPAAETEAIEAARYIARHSPRNAARWLEGLQQTVDSLSLFPQRCAIAPEAEYLNRPLRHAIYKSHRIIFEILDQKRRVRVLHVRHGARRAIGEPNPPEDK